MQYPNIYSLFRAQCDRYRDRNVFYTRDGDGWTAQTWGEFEDKVNDLACALLAKGLTKGSSVAILAGNVPEWTICDIAVIAAGGVGVGIYPTSSTEQAHYIINHSEAEFLLVENDDQVEKIGDTNEEYPKLKEIFIIGEPQDRSVELVRSEKKGIIFKSFTVDEIPVSRFDEVIEFGRSRRNELLTQVARIGRAARPDDTAIMVYTSGTTGQPKGAMLSHKYILNSVESLRRSVPIFETDVALSYLPGCHVAERISGIYNRLYSGTPAYFVDDLSKLYEYMFEVKPTVFASLPRFFEKIHAKVAADPAAGKEELKAAFGGNVRLLTSGGAPLPLEIADFYSRHGLPILQAYGLTENICVAFNTATEHKFGTVGKPMPMCEVRIAEDGEILVKSEMMFSGYYKEPEKTAEMFDDAGWLKTGDLGELDEDGFLKITGRKKEIIVLSNGKNVAPALVENYVKESHLISHCFLYGDGRSYCVALITINVNEAASMCREQIEGLVEQAVEQANARVSSSEQIKRFVILEQDFSAERDEITPTMKLKRNIVAANYRDTLEKMYEN